jgi:hypothetical protein
MVLRVELDRFAEEVAARLSIHDVYVGRTAVGCLATAGDPSRDFVIAASTSKSVEETRTYLSRAGLHVNLGGWDTEGDEIAPDELPAWIAAVAYRTNDPKPGLWIDAYAHEPTPAEILMRLYDEFRETGEMGEIPFEEFMRFASPTVVVVKPEEVQRYVERNSPSDDC